ncbi:MAG: hypothetical protein ABI972_26210 [Acidobacteriota bacterium]
MQFHVQWNIDIEAGTAEQAAAQALAIQRDPDSMATVFDVQLTQPCPRCKQIVVRTPTCRSAARKRDSHVQAWRSIDDARAKGPR